MEEHRILWGMAAGGTIFETELGFFKQIKLHCATLKDHRAALFMVKNGTKKRGISPGIVEIIH